MWEKTKKPSFLDNTDFRKKHKEAELPLSNSFREYLDIGALTDREGFKTHREHSR